MDNEGPASTTMNTEPLRENHVSQETCHSPSDKSVTKKRVRIEEDASVLEGLQQQRRKNSLNPLDNPPLVSRNNHRGMDTFSNTKLDKSTLHLLQVIADEELFKKTILLTHGIDNERFSIEHLNRTKLEEGSKILHDIQNIFNDPTQDPIELMLLSYKFYKHFPHRPQAAPMYSGMVSNLPPIIQTQQQLESKFRFLELLSIINCSLELIQSSRLIARQDISQSYYDVLHDKLNFKPEPLSKTSPRYELISRFVSNTVDGSPFHLENIFTVNSSPEKSKSPTLENRMLLCRGATPFKNLSILQNGIEYSTKDTNQTANAFLFADVCYPSVEESFPGEESASFCVFLYEVALGNAYEDDFIVKERPKGYDSVICRGSMGPDPSQHVMTEEGYVIPMGKPRPYTRTSLAASITKFYVYNKEQVRLRYVCEMKYSPSRAMVPQKIPLIPFHALVSSNLSLRGMSPLMPASPGSMLSAAAAVVAAQQQQQQQQQHPHHHQRISSPIPSPLITVSASGGNSLSSPSIPNHISSSTTPYNL